MKAKFKFKVLIYGQMKTIIKEFDCPDGMNEDELMDWMDCQDKTTFMAKHDIDTIFDYSVYKNTQKIKQLTFIEYAKYAFEGTKNEKFITDFFAVYATIKDNIKGLSNMKQFQLVMSHLDVAYTASGNAYTRITRILNGQSPDDVESDGEMIKIEE